MLPGTSTKLVYESIGGTTVSSSLSSEQMNGALSGAALYRHASQRSIDFTSFENLCRFVSFASSSSLCKLLIPLSFYF